MRAADKYLGNALEAHAFHPHGEVIGLLVVDGHAVHIVPAVGVVPGVFQMIDAADIEHKIVRVVGIHAPHIGNVSGTCTVYIPIEPVCASRVHMAFGIEIVVREIRKFKRVINDHFRIQTAVCGLIDVFKEDTVKFF